MKRRKKKFKEKEQIQEYQMKLLHTSRYGNKEQLSSLMKSEIFENLTEKEQLY